MTYPQWWERLVAAIIDGIILVVVTLIVTLILQAVASGSRGFLMVMTVVATLINFAIIVAYKVVMESSKYQATVGKIVFGLQLTDDAGGRVPMQQALMRTWPWWLQLLTIFAAFSATLGTVLSLLVVIGMILVFCSFFMAPIGRCIHDQTANCHVVKSGKGLIDTGTMG